MLQLISELRLQILEVICLKDIQSSWQLIWGQWALLIDNGDGTFTAKYTAVDTIGDATITVETDDGKSAYASITLLRVVSNVEELKGIKAKKIVWKKDGAKMARIPTIVFKQKKTFNRIGEPIVKTVKVDGPDSIPFYMDTNFSLPIAVVKSLVYCLFRNDAT